MTSYASITTAVTLTIRHMKSMGDPVLSTFLLNTVLSTISFCRLKRVDKMVKYPKKHRVDKMVFLMLILPFYPRCVF